MGPSHGRHWLLELLCCYGGRTSDDVKETEERKEEYQKKKKQYKRAKLQYLQKGLRYERDLRATREMQWQEEKQEIMMNLEKVELKNRNLRGEIVLHELDVTQKMEKMRATMKTLSEDKLKMIRHVQRLEGITKKLENNRQKINYEKERCRELEVKVKKEKLKEMEEALEVVIQDREEMINKIQELEELQKKELQVEMQKVESVEDNVHQDVDQLPERNLETMRASAENDVAPHFQEEKKQNELEKIPQKKEKRMKTTEIDPEQQCKRTQEHEEREESLKTAEDKPVELITKQAEKKEVKELTIRKQRNNDALGHFSKLLSFWENLCAGSDQQHQILDSSIVDI